MVLVAFLYRRNLEKLSLSKLQLQKLRKKMTPENICYGPFMVSERMCPNTTALSLKKEKQILNPKTIRRELNLFGIKSLDLLFFYVVFDVPSMLSRAFFVNSLEAMRESIDELIQEKR